VALVAAAVLAAGEREASTRNFAPLVQPADQPAIERVAATLLLAEALVRYGGADLDRAWPERRDGQVHVPAQLSDSWPLEAPTRRAERAFGLKLSLGAATG
jgi:hypothetical protein